MPRKPRSGESIVDEKQFNELKDSIRNYIQTMPDGNNTMLSEKSIAEEFRLTQTGSRRILMRLEAEGVLESIPSRGYRRVDYSNTTVRTFWFVRRSLETEAVRLAAARATREDLLRLMLILEEAKEKTNPGFFRDFFNLDRDFHRALLEASHDNMLKNLYSMIDFSIPSQDGFPIPLDREQVNLEALCAHQEIFTAIKARDADAAVIYLGNHLRPTISNRLISESIKEIQPVLLPWLAHDKNVSEDPDSNEGRIMNNRRQETRKTARPSNKTSSPNKTRKDEK